MRFEHIFFALKYSFLTEFEAHCILVESPEGKSLPGTETMGTNTTRVLRNPELPSRHDLSLLTHTYLIPQLPVVPRRMLIGLNRCLLQTQKHSLEA